MPIKFLTLSLLSGTVGVMAVGYITASNFQKNTLYQKLQVPIVLSDENASEEETELVQSLDITTALPTPATVRSIYMSSCVVGTPSFRDKLVQLVEETTLNSIVIDVKDYSGTLSYPPTNPALYPAWENSPCGTKDMKEFLHDLQERGIYTIARITVAQDPFYAPRNVAVAVQNPDGSVWRDNKGLSFLDPLAPAVQERTVALAVDAHEVGFDEINFDYIRYPSDGLISQAVFPVTGNQPKDITLEKFFSYLHKEMSKRNIVTSADIFGIVTSSAPHVHHNIGQVLERTLPYFDYVAPMVYPSHYPSGWRGIGNPNTVPGRVVGLAMGDAVARATAGCKPLTREVTEEIEETVTNADGTQGVKVVNKTRTEEVAPALETNSFTKSGDADLPRVCYGGDRLRTWIQDFDYGGEYGEVEVRAQIQAAAAVGVDSYMVWAPSNIYTFNAYK